MLEDLKNINYSLTKDNFIYFMVDVFGNNRYDITSLSVLCNHAPGRLQLLFSDLLNYCIAFEWVLREENVYFLSPSIIKYIDDKEKLNDKLVKDSVIMLFNANLINADMFIYEANTDKIRFKNERFSLEFSIIRNALISQGLFEIRRTTKRTYFYLSETYFNFVSSFIKQQKKKLSLDQLKRKLEENEKSGDLAERFVLEFEQKRLPASLRSKIRIISSIDVTAGYDIVSFESANSLEIDRFIEVKAINHERRFFWSQNEYEVAKLKGNRYYLYLVELNNIRKADYKPIIICDPVNSVMKSDEWLVETQTFCVRHISS
ncbi:DUF3883 domain-containing protein [Lacrimispora saccharolytica]|nr:DUF3883 domain-containing protein [Lacrimispora saccharolytica]